MPSVVRSTFVLGVFAFAAATATACGDKVNVTQPAKDSSVQSVTVSPPGPIAMKIGDKVTFAASVQGGPDLTNRAVTWKSSATAVATVDNNGVVTAVSGGTASIIATSVQNTGVSGAAVVTVGANVPATISISSVNQTTCSIFGTCSSVPANIAAIMGQIDVTMNVDPGTQTLTGVDLILNCSGTGNSGTDTVVASQNLGADRAPIASEAASAPVQLSFNTASFNATTGAVSFKNGSCTIKGRARTAAGTQSGSNTEILTLVNPDVIVGTMASSKQALNPGTGLSWHGGDVTIGVTPVFFTPGRSAVSTTINFEGATATATGSGAQSVTFLDTNNPASTSPLNIDGITDAFADEELGVTAVDNSGNNFFNPNGSAIVTAASYLANPAAGGVPPFGGTNPFRLDTQRPFSGTFALASNADQGTSVNGYVGASFRFAADSAAGYRGPDQIAGNRTRNLDHNGVDNVAVVFQQGTSNTGTWTAVTNTTNLAETATASSFTLRQITTDALGNADTAYADLVPTHFPQNTIPAAAKFGVDKTPPHITLTSGPANDSVSQALGGTGNYVFSITDTLSGPHAQALVAVVRQQAAISSNNIPAEGTVMTNGTESNGNGAGCVIGRFNKTQAAAGANAVTVLAKDGSTLGFCTPTSYTLTGGTTIAANFGASVSGYVTTRVIGVDEAGNQSPVFTNIVAEDNANPAAGPGIDLPQSIAGGATATFPTNSTDNLDITGSVAQLRYPGVGMTLQYAQTNAGAGVAFDNVLTTSATVTPSVALFLRNIQAAAVAQPAAPTNAMAPDAVNVAAFDESGRAGVSGFITLSPLVSISQPSSNPWSSQFTGGTTITANNANVTNCPASGCGPSGTTTPANPTTTTFTVTAAGVSGQLANPFTTVQVWAQVGAGSWFLIGTTGGGSSRDTGVGGNRFWDFTFTWDPPASLPFDAATSAAASLTPANATTIPVNIRGIGITANGDAVATATIVVTLVNP